MRWSWGGVCGVFYSVSLHQRTFSKFQSHLIFLWVYNAMRWKWRRVSLSCLHFVHIKSCDLSFNSTNFTCIALNVFKINCKVKIYNVMLINNSEKFWSQMRLMSQHSRCFACAGPKKEHDRKCEKERKRKKKSA